MMQGKENIVPITLAILLHVVLFGSLVVVIDFSGRNDLVIPLAINATLVTENAVVIPPKVEEPPEPDTREQDRLAAEKLKREDDARVERERLQKIDRDKAEADRRRIADQEKLRIERETEDERRRVATEEKRQEDIERQRAENERLRKEADDAARQKEIDDEAERVEAMTTNAKAAYMYAIQQDIARNWVKPPTAGLGLECVVNVRQLPGGEVVSVSIGSCNGDEAVKRSIETAVHKASPLPKPQDPRVFDRDIRLTFRPEE